MQRGSAAAAAAAALLQLAAHAARRGRVPASNGDSADEHGSASPRNQPHATSVPMLPPEIQAPAVLTGLQQAVLCSQFPDPSLQQVRMEPLGDDVRGPSHCDL